MKEENNGTFVVTLKHFLSDCSFYETITVLENIGAKIEDVLDQRIIRFKTGLSTVSIIDHLYRLTSVEYLLKEIALCNEKLEKHVVEISRTIKNRRYIDIVFLDPYNNYGREKKDEIKQKLIQVIRAYNENIKLSRKEPDLRLFVLALNKETFTINIHVKTFRRDRFKFRSPEKRVYFQSSALNPQSSLLLINLATHPNNETVVLDPFCGTGSTLIEASLQGHYCIGIDLDYKMIMGAKRNLKQYNVYHQADLILADSLLIPLRDKSVRAIATDPPYGRLASTKGKPREKIFHGIIEVSKRILKRGGKTALFLPAPEVLEKDERLRRRKVCSIYLHSDLTRNVWVLEK